MGLAMTVNVKVVEDALGGAAGAREYLNRLATQKVMFLNGPESPGPCVRCLSYHGTVWKKAAANRPRPPLHPNCYCREVSYRDPSAGVAAPSRHKPGQFLAQKITKMSLRRREILMGKGVARLHRLGIVETGDLMSRSGGLRTLEQLLKSKLNITASQFGKLTDGQLLEGFEALRKAR